MKSSIIGRPLPQVDGIEKATGTLIFLDDLSFPRLLVGKLLRSPLPHARILNVDVSRAKKIVGVRAVVTGEDTPKKLCGPIVADEPVLAFDRVRYIGDEVAAVAAESLEAAEEALSLIQVDYEELPAVFDPEEAISEAAPRLHPQGNLAYRFSYSRGEVARDLERSDLVLESCYRTSRVHQVYMEPRGCVAMAGPGGQLTIWGSFSMVFAIRAQVASALKLDPGKVRVIQTSTGGSFGGKGSSSKAPICALLALKTGRPVKIVNTWEEEFSAGRPRVPGVIRQKIGVKRDGTLLARKVKVICDCGAYSGITPHIAETMTIRAENIYRFPSVEGEGLLAYTNLTPTGPHRAFGDPPGIFALEAQLDEVASALGMDPLELRLKNIVGPNQVTVHGWQITSCGLADCLKDVAQRSGWQEKWKERPPGYGIGVACGIQVSGTRRLHDYDGAAALIKLDPSGQVTISIGESDVGQGARTVLAQIAAQELGISLGRIKVILGDTDLTPYGVGAIASRITVVGGNAVKAAARDMRQQLLQVAAEILEAHPADLIAEGEKIFVRGSPERGITFQDACARAVYRRGGGPIIASGIYDPPTVVPDESLYGNYSIAYPFCAQVAEVRVDEETGEVKVLALYSTEDVGQVINPLAQEGQVQGCLSQGQGLATGEEIVYEKGKVVNGSFADYKVPCALDLVSPSLSFVDTYDPHGPFGAKSGGEGAISPLPAAIANAIYHATGVGMRSLPITTQKVFNAIKNQRERPTCG